MIELDDIERSFLLEGLGDYIGLWQFARQERRCEPAATDEQIRQRALHRIERLLQGGFMRAGTLAPDGGFQEWALDPNSSLQRISREWHSLGHDPDIADICWFQNTDQGDRAVRHSEA